MTEKQFKDELEHIFIRYAPFLRTDQRYSYDTDLFAEHMRGMKDEVMALDGVPVEKKLKAGEELERRIKDFVDEHNRKAGVSR